MNETRLQRAFMDALAIDGDIPWDSLEYRSIPEWDSVAHMQLIAEIEDVFDVMLETDDVIALSSFRIAEQILERYGVSFGQ